MTIRPPPGIITSFAFILGAGACGPERSMTTSSTSEPMTSSGSTAPPTSSEGSSTGSSSTDAASTSATSATSTGEAGDCGGPCGNPEHICCGGECVDPRNDRNHCGRCGLVCAEPTPFCGAGTCAVTPCDGTCGADETCCGAICCGDGTICCEINGPVQIGAGCVEPTAEGSCPPGCSPLCQCAAPDTPIATPEGDRRIAELRPGDLVYSVDDGQTIAVPIAAVRRTPVADHRVIRVVLGDGHTIEISPSHPLGDGRTFADLRPGDALDGDPLIAVDLVPYAHAATHDILPASDTGAYFVHGILVGSTLAPVARGPLPRLRGALSDESGVRERKDQGPGVASPSACHAPRGSSSPCTSSSTWRSPGR